MNFHFSLRNHVDLMEPQENSMYGGSVQKDSNHQQNFMMTERDSMTITLWIKAFDGELNVVVLLAFELYFIYTNYQNTNYHVHR